MCYLAEVMVLLRDVYKDYYLGLDKDEAHSPVIIYAPKMGEQKIVFRAPSGSDDPYIDILNFLKAL